MTFKKPPQTTGPCNAELAARIEVLISQNDRLLAQNAIIIDLLVKGAVRDVTIKE